MSNPAMLAIAPLTARQADQWTGRFEERLTAVAGLDAVAAGFAAWSRAGPFLADDVQRIFGHAMVDWPFLADLTGEIGDETAGVEILVMRKQAPMAVLMTGMGWDRARRLPGLAGLWLLDPDGVRAKAGDVEQAFALTDAERSAVLDRMAQALALGDEPNFDLEHLLAVVPKAFEVAASQGMGMVCCTAVVT